MPNKKSILITDDDAVIRKLIDKALRDQYTVLQAENGKDGIEKALQEQPDLILLDVEMAGMNGYEVCDQLKQTPATKTIPIVFLSDKTSVRERMLGYEAGASDFIVKPCDIQELKAKLQVLLDQNDTQKQLTSKYQAAVQTAMVAMRGSSEIGRAIQFIHDSYTIRSFERLAARFLTVTESLNLKCSLLFVTRSGRLYFSGKGLVSPLERDVIESLFKQQTRIVDFGIRTQFNYQRVALLVKNMPLQDREAYGRYKDLLPYMLGSTDAKIKNLDTEQALLEQTRNITESFDAVRGTLQAIGSSMTDNQEKVVGTLKRLLAEFDHQLPKLGLEDDQERYLLSTLDSTLLSAQEIIEGGKKAQDSFNTVGRLLDHLSVRQQQLLKEVVTELDDSPKPEATEAVEEETLTGDIELF